nr:hypothetical protein Iba_chr12cCG3190 [Ipomoea batatas]
MPLKQLTDSQTVGGRSEKAGVRSGKVVSSKCESYRPWGLDTQRRDSGETEGMPIAKNLDEII